MTITSPKSGCLLPRGNCSFVGVLTASVVGSSAHRGNFQPFLDAPCTRMSYHDLRCNDSSLRDALHVDQQQHVDSIASLPLPSPTRTRQELQRSVTSLASLRRNRFLASDSPTAPEPSLTEAVPTNELTTLSTVAHVLSLHFSTSSASPTASKDTLLM